MENEKIIKILHGCDSDLKFLKKDFNFEIKNLYDT